MPEVTVPTGDSKTEKVLFWVLTASNIMQAFLVPIAEAMKFLQANAPNVHDEIEKQLALRQQQAHERGEGNG